MKVTCISDISQSNQNHASHLYSNDMSRRERSKEEQFEDTKGAFRNHFTGYDHIEYLLIRYMTFATNRIARSKQSKLILNCNAFIV